MVFCLHVHPLLYMHYCTSIMCVDMCSSYGGQKRVTDVLELELQMLGIKPRPLGRAARALSCGALSPALGFQCKGSDVWYSSNHQL